MLYHRGESETQGIDLVKLRYCSHLDGDTQLAPNSPTAYGLPIHSYLSKPTSHSISATENLYVEGVNAASTSDGIAADGKVVREWLDEVDATAPSTMTQQHDEHCTHPAVRQVVYDASTSNE